MKTFPPTTRQSIRKQLLNWFDQTQRNLPWRKNKDPYRIWISEIMLQQTQVKTVIPYFNKFMKEFPTLRSLANAPLDKVLEQWSGLGYYRRARHLHETAQILRDQYHCKFPQDFQQVLSLPGLGRYSAGAILSIAYGQNLPVVDGNVMRVFARLCTSRIDPRSTEGQKKMWTLAEQFLPQGRAGDFNQALMELGARICTPKSPHCTLCPIRSSCKACKEGQPEKYPIKKKKTVYKIHFQVCPVVQRENRYLILYDPTEGWYRDLWHLPFFEIASKRFQKRTLEKMFMEHFGIEIKVNRKINDHQFTITNHRITQTNVLCYYVKGRIQAKPGRKIKWVSLKTLDGIALPASQKGLVAALMRNPQNL